MSSRDCFSAIIGGCFAVFAACASAQAPVASSSDATTGATDASAPQQQVAAATQSKAHPKKQKSTNAMRTSKAAVSPQESEYRTALRRCVEGQASQRDRCLDDAISRYGRS